MKRNLNVKVLFLCQRTENGSVNVVAVSQNNNVGRVPNGQLKTESVFVLSVVCVCVWGGGGGGGIAAIIQQQKTQRFLHVLFKTNSLVLA